MVYVQVASPLGHMTLNKKKTSGLAVKFKMAAKTRVFNFVQFS